MSSRGDVFHTLGSQVITIPIQMIIGILVAREIGPEGKGVLSFITVVSMFLVSIFSIGVPSTMKYMLASGQTEIKDSLFTAILFIVNMVFLAFLGSYVLWKVNYFGTIGNALNEIQFTIFGILLLFSGLNAVTSFSLLGISKFRYHNISSLVQRILIIIFLLILVFLFRFGLYGALWTYAISNFIYFIVMMVIIVKHDKPNLWINFNIFQRFRSYSLRVWLGSITTVFSQRLDQFIVAFFFGSVELGLFAIAAQFAEYIVFIPTATDNVFFNKIAGLKSLKEQGFFTVRYLKFIFPFTLVLGLGAMVFGYFMIPLLMGKEYAGSEVLFLLYAPGVILWIIPKYFIKFFSATGHPQYSTLITISNVVVMTLFYYPMMLWAGVKGLAVTLTITSLIAILLAIYFFTKRLGQSIKLTYCKEDFMWLKKILKLSKI